MKETIQRIWSTCKAFALAGEDFSLKAKKVHCLRAFLDGMTAKLKPATVARIRAMALAGMIDLTNEEGIVDEVVNAFHATLSIPALYAMMPEQMIKLLMSCFVYGIASSSVMPAFTPALTAFVMAARLTNTYHSFIYDVIGTSHEVVMTEELQELNANSTTTPTGLGKSRLQPCDPSRN